MQRLSSRLAELDASRLVAGLGSLILLLLLAGWVSGVVAGSALAGQVAAAVGSVLILVVALLYAFRLRTSPASE